MEKILSKTYDEKQLRTKQNSDELIRLLQSWREEEDEEEQQETWEYLKHVLDEDRLSDRSLFS